jgi:hypothetical protein
MAFLLDHPHYSTCPTSLMSENTEQDDAIDSWERLYMILEAAEDIVSGGGLSTAPVTTPQWPSLTSIPEPTPLAPWVNRNPSETFIIHDDVPSPAPNPRSASDLLSFLQQADDTASSTTRVSRDSYVTSRYGGNDVSGHENDRRGQQQPTIRPEPVMTSATSRRLQDGQWNQRFQDLLQFCAGHRHALVPHRYPPNQKLSQWVKRQRYQRCLKERGLQSTLTDEREQRLVDVGFVWNSHDASWQEHFESYERFVMVHSADCGVPLNYSPDPSLSTWCKHQRRQYKCMVAGLPSTLTPERIEKLNSVGFSWNPRNLSRC